MLSNEHRSAERSSSIGAQLLAAFSVAFVLFFLLLSSPSPARAQFVTHTPISASSTPLPPTATPSGGDWFTPYPTLVVCEPTSEPSVTPLSTLDLPTPDGTLVTYTPGPTATVTGTPAPWKIIPRDDDYVMPYYTSGEDGAIDISYEQIIPPMVDGHYDAGLPWYKIVDSLGTPAPYGSEFTIYYRIDFSTGYDISNATEPCDDAYVNRNHQALGSINLLAAGSFGNYFVLNDPFDSGLTVVHCAGTGGPFSDASVHRSGSFLVFSNGTGAIFRFGYDVAHVRQIAGDGHVSVSGRGRYSLTPIPSDTPTPTPTPGPGDGDPCTPPEPPSVCYTDCIVLDPPILNPGGCFTIVPGGTLPLPDSLAYLGVPASIEIPGFQICVQYLVVNIVFLGFDLSPWILTLTGLTAIMIVYKELKS